jgi:hypothetical protein
MQVGDLIMYGDSHYGHNRFWEVRSVCLGAVGQEGLVELKSLNEKPGRDTQGVHHDTTWVPECLLRDAKVYRFLNTSAIASDARNCQSTQQGAEGTEKCYPANRA